MKKILWGISGIGTGHTHRQRPLIDHFAKTCKLVIFAYQESYRFYKEYCKRMKNVTVVLIDIPFWAGKKEGLDFDATLKRNYGKDFLSINCKALSYAEKLIGKPDLVITDYEPLSAQYAYAMNAPLVTLDQQSKYLYGSFPKEIGGESYLDETMRLRMFFPKADARIACSFFKVEKKVDKSDNTFDKKVKNEKKETEHENTKKENVHSFDVEIVPSTLKEEIIKLPHKINNETKEKNIFIVYISSQREFVQSISSVIDACHVQKNAEFHIFLRNAKMYESKIVKKTSNLKSIRNRDINVEKNNAAVINDSAVIFLHEHGDPIFYLLLSECRGIISTAGHMLLSEAMYLGIPIYAIPLAVYEQQMNAYVINQNKFGISHPSIVKNKLAEFISQVDVFEKNIKNDKMVLVRGAGQDKIIKYLESTFLQG